MMINFDEDLSNDLERKEINGIVLKMIAEEENLKDVHDLLGLSLGKLLNIRFNYQTKTHLGLKRLLILKF
jgi:hypothetical protein